jgi:hypothetical protein
MFGKTAKVMEQSSEYIANFYERSLDRRQAERKSGGERRRLDPRIFALLLD